MPHEHFPPLTLSVRVGCELVYSAPAETPALVLVRPRLSPTQVIREERLHFEPGLHPSEFEDVHGNLAQRLLLHAGKNFLRHDAIVRVSALPESNGDGEGVVPVHALPSELLRYIMPSRYVDSDKLLDFAWQNFGHIDHGLLRAQAICDWVSERIEYRVGSGDPRLSASEVLARGYGVCRDFAHLTLAFFRAFNLPARYVTGHLPDIGVPDPGSPFDFHAYCEVYLGGRWVTFDARFNTPRIGRVKIAVGLDAADCAFTTAFGAAQLERFEVWAYQVDGSVVSTRDPIDLHQRLDGTPEVRFPQRRS